MTSSVVTSKVVEIYNSEKLYELGYNEALDYTERCLNRVRLILKKSNKYANAIRINSFNGRSNKVKVGLVSMKNDLLSYMVSENTGNIVIKHFDGLVFADIYYTNCGEWHRFELEPVTVVK